ncbi:MAG: hypothetical protein KAH54_09025 [Candidatus Sabulitectum sp.]|nr:hypothetical protein [Candidatus Sabulitectum sp.]
MDLARDHWKTIWEDRADEEKKSYDSMTVEEVLLKVREGHYGEYYSIWYSISEQATLEQADRIRMSFWQGLKRR